jgi:hypothetical protein
MHACQPVLVLLLEKAMGEWCSYAGRNCVCLCVDVDGCMAGVDVPV